MRCEKSRDPVGRASIAPLVSMGASLVSRGASRENWNTNEYSKYAIPSYTLSIGTISRSMFGTCL